MSLLVRDSRGWFPVPTGNPGSDEKIVEKGRQQPKRVYNGCHFKAIKGIPFFWSTLSKKMNIEGR